MNPVLLLIPVLIIVVMGYNYFVRQRDIAKVTPTWAKASKQLVDGVVDGDGAKGTYEGRQIRASVKTQNDLLMPNPFGHGFVRQELGGWIYKVTTTVPSKGGQGWTLSYDGSIITTSEGFSDRFLEQFRQGGLELEFAKVGAGQLVLDGTGVLTLERYFPVNDQGRVKNDVAPVPTRAQFRLECALLDGTAKLIATT